MQKLQFVFVYIVLSLFFVFQTQISAKMSSVGKAVEISNVGYEPWCSRLYDYEEGKGLQSCFNEKEDPTEEIYYNIEVDELGGSSSNVLVVYRRVIGQAEDQKVMIYPFFQGDANVAGNLARGYTGGLVLYMTGTVIYFLTKVKKSENAVGAMGAPFAALSFIIIPAASAALYLVAGYERVVEGEMVEQSVENFGLYELKEHSGTYTFRDYGYGNTLKVGIAEDKSGVGYVANMTLVKGLTEDDSSNDDVAIDSDIPIESN